MTNQDITFKEIVQGIYASPRMQALLNPTPTLARINHVPEVREIIENLPHDLKCKLENLVEEERNAPKNAENPFYDYYAVLEVSVSGEKKAILKGYDPYMAENTWYAKEEPQKALQSLRTPQYPMRINEDVFQKIQRTFQFFLTQFKGYKEVDFTVHLVNRATKARLGQFIQTKRNSGEFVFLPENNFITVQKAY